MIAIDSENAAKILANLYNAAIPQGLGLLHYKPNPWNESVARSYLESREFYTRGEIYIDYLQGRVMKLLFKVGSPLEFALYDRDNPIPGHRVMALMGVVYGP
jgi:hypothetical protein